MRLTASTIRSLKLKPTENDRVFWDDDVPGFGLRLRRSGASAWLCQYKLHGRTRRYTLGKPNELDPGRAREAARDILARVRLGEDPAADKAEKRIEATQTFGRWLEPYLAHKKAKLKPSSYVAVHRHLMSYAKPLHGRSIQSIGLTDIATLLSVIAKQNGPGAANRARASLSGYFSWLGGEGLLGEHPTNPVAFTNKKDENGSRERKLSDDELAVVWKACEGQYGRIVKLLMLTGARRQEIGGLRWSEVDLDAATITLPKARTKNNREHTIPLSEQAVAILADQARDHGKDRTFVFGRGYSGWQNWSESRAELEQRLDGKVAPFVLHDLRRSISTSLHEDFHVQPHIVEAILGHVSGHKAGVAGVYNLAPYIDERRWTLQRWADHVVSLVGGKPGGKVITLKRRR
jgi:integrase